MDKDERFQIYKTLRVSIMKRTGFNVSFRDNCSAFSIKKRKDSFSLARLDSRTEKIQHVLSN